MKNDKPELPIVEIYSIFDIHANGYFYSSQVLSPSSEARESIEGGYPDTYAEVVEMQEIKPYTDYNEMYGEVKVPGLQNLDSVNDLSDYELSELFLKAQGITLSDVGKLKNLGYILQEEPVEYTFVIKAQSKTYRVIADPITHDSQKLYRKTIFVDYDDWRTGKSIDENHISQELEKLCKNGKIKEVEQHNMMS